MKESYENVPAITDKTLFLLMTKIDWFKVCVAIVISVQLTACGFNSVAGPQSKTKQIELWLVSGELCNTCSIFNEVKEAKGYGSGFRYVLETGEQAGTLVEARIKHIKKDDLQKSIVAQLSNDSGIESDQWSIMLTVIVVDNGSVLAAGNIADSADISSATYSSEIMQPPASPNDDHPSLHPTNAYKDFFTRHWNLEYFLEKAFNPSYRIVNASPLPDVEPLGLGEKNVIIWGAASNPFKNALFISERMLEIREQLTALDSGDAHYVNLYANGEASSSRNTSTVVDGDVQFQRIIIPGSIPASKVGIARLLGGLKAKPDASTLLIQVGHSAPYGAPIYGSLQPLQPEVLEAGAQDADVVMISGACHSGIYANVGRCGFFAAHPEVVSSGCQKTEEAIRNSDDYLRMFFRALEPHNKSQSDSNSDDRVSFAEAHWYATTQVEDHNLPYTTLDKLADDYFAKYPEKLPEALSLAQAQALLSGASPEEREAFLRMTEGHSATAVLQLSELITRNEQANQQLHDAQAWEWPSQKRDEQLALPYKLSLITLTKRLLLRKHAATDAKMNSNLTNKMERVQACEAQAIIDYL